MFMGSMQYRQRIVCIIVELRKKLLSCIDESGLRQDGSPALASNIYLPKLGTVLFSLSVVAMLDKS